MSGIVGVLEFSGRPACEDDVCRALRAMAHLGPDGARALCDGPVGFGALTLEVTGEDRYDVQPIAEPDGLLLAADARLDNRADLAADLGLVGDLDATPDSLLLLAAWRRWGEACVERLVGDFAFAVWDPGRRELTLARDHMGQRHVFFHRGPDCFAFATEVKGLWALPQTPREISDAALARWLLVDGAPGGTLFEGIEAVRGGMTLTVGADGAVRTRRYWSPHAAPEHVGRDEAYYVQAYRRVLGEAVACRLRRATRPAALMLSGGFDSAGIAALAAPALSGRKLVAITAAPPAAAGACAAASGARRWAEVCRRAMPHLDLRYVTFEGDDVLRGAARLGLAMDRPASPNAYALDAACRAASAAGARVLLDGYGGDYTLNPRGGRPLARWLLAGRLRTWLSEFRAQRRWRREPLWSALKREALLPFAPAGLVRAWSRLRADRRAPAAPHAATAALEREARAAGVRPFGPRRPRLHQLRALSLRLLEGAQDGPTAAGVIYGAHRLQLTQPFHDKRVVELALAIPEDLYFRDGRARHLARTALADLYPPEFQTPPPGNTPFIADYDEMIERIRPQLDAEIERLEQRPRLARCIDFRRLRALIGPGGDAAGPRLRLAARTLLIAQYLDAFWRENE